MSGGEAEWDGVGAVGSTEFVCIFATENKRDGDMIEIIFILVHILRSKFDCVNRRAS